VIAEELEFHMLWGSGGGVPPCNLIVVSCPLIIMWSQCPRASRDRIARALSAVALLYVMEGYTDANEAGCGVFLGGRDTADLITARHCDVRMCLDWLRPEYAHFDVWSCVVCQRQIFIGLQVIWPVPVAARSKA